MTPRAPHPSGFSKAGDPSMQTPETILVIAGSGGYPLRLIRGARDAGVGRIVMLAFRGQTDRRAAAEADEVVWLRVGELRRMLTVSVRLGIPQAVMAGQITPAALFHARFDPMARKELAGLPVKNAHTIFGRLVRLLEERGMELLPASLFMGACVPAPGLLTQRAPDPRESADIERGLSAAMAVGEHDVGQTVVVRQGMVVAVEAFEGTNRAILRGARLGGRGCVVVKTARQGHDMRFDIPVVGFQTLRVLRRAHVSALAVHAGRVILLDRDRVVEYADRNGIAILAVANTLPPAPVLAPAGDAGPGREPSKEAPAAAPLPARPDSP